MKNLIITLVVLIIVLAGGTLLWRYITGPSSADDSLRTATMGGVTFQYPLLQGSYVRVQEWPAPVTISQGDFSCGAAAMPPVTREQRSINGRIYCVDTEAEGAAGSTYTTYTYTTARGTGQLAMVSFTVQMPQCLNYDEPQQAACAAEQASFQPDNIAGIMLQSATTQNGA